VRQRTLDVCASAHAHRLPGWALAPDLLRASETVVRLKPNTTGKSETEVRLKPDYRQMVYGSSALGPYTCGTVDPIGRRYVVIWPRWCTMSKRKLHAMGDAGR
jgi:hypothetical protein